MFVMQAAITIANQTFPELPIPDRHCQCVTNQHGHHLTPTIFSHGYRLNTGVTRRETSKIPGLIVSPTQATTANQYPQPEISIFYILQQR